MIVLPPSRGSRRIRLSNMTPCEPRLLIVPDWCTSKCGGRIVMPTRSVPPRFGFGSGAASWNFEPSNSIGTRAAQPETPAHRIGAGRERGAALQELAAAPPRTGGVLDRSSGVSPFGSFQHRARRALICLARGKISSNGQVSLLNDTRTDRRRSPSARRVRPSAAPLLEIEDLQTHFFTAVRHRAGGRRGFLRGARRRDAGRRRRERLRQERHGAVDPAPRGRPAGADRRRRDPLRRRQSAGAERRRDGGHSRQRRSR